MTKGRVVVSFRVARAFCAAIVLALCGCGGGGGGGSTAGAPATPAPPPGPVPVPNISPLQLAGIGSQYAKTITVTQTGYSGAFTLGGTSCNGVVSADTTTSSHDFTITPLAVGTCSYTITGGGAQSTLPVSVTTLTVGGK